MPAINRVRNAISRYQQAPLAVQDRLERNGWGYPNRIDFKRSEIASSEQGEGHHSRVNDNIRLEPLDIHRHVPKPERTLRSVERQIVLSDRNRQERISNDIGLEQALDVRSKTGLLVKDRKSGDLWDGDESCGVASRPSEVKHGLVEVIGENESPFLPSENPNELGTVGEEVGLVGRWGGGCFSGTIVDGRSGDDDGRNRAR